jgi:hypothetical protein
MTAGPEPDSEPLGRPRLQLTPANPSRTHRTARPRPREGRRCAVRSHHAAELVPHDHRLVRPHDPGVADQRGGVGEVVGVMAGVQVRAADPGADHLEEDLALSRLGVEHVGDLEPALGAGHGPHDLAP